MNDNVLNFLMHKYLFAKRSVLISNSYIVKINKDRGCRLTFDTKNQQFETYHLEDSINIEELNRDYILFNLGLL